ncbi:MAG: hypothetical protein M3Y45_05545, partial [Actinomycetota bacterium]|nr:hypothetical protein [Actinomycetota bacterium]
LIALAASPSTATFSGKNGQISFSRDIGNHREIFTANSDGSQIKKVTVSKPAGAVSFESDWSPDGELIAFDSNRNDSRFEIYTMDTTGGDVTRLTEIADGTSQEPAFSPDGDRIAFRAGSVLSGGISLVPATGGSPAAVTEGTDDASPAWQALEPVPVPPTAQITGGPDGLTNKATASFTFTSDISGSDFECRLDPVEATEDDPATAWVECDSPYETGELTDGNHRFEVRAVSGTIGNGPAVARNWTVDTVAPGIELTSVPDEITSETEATFEFTVDDAAATVECRIDPVEETEEAPATEWTACESPRSYPGLADGPHRFEIRAADEAGNTGRTSHEWSVDSTPPVVTFDQAPDALSTEASPTFAFSADDAGSEFECRLDPVEETEEVPATEWVACESPHALEDLTEGEHVFEVRATNPLGSTSDPVIHTWVVDTVAPVVELTANPDALTAESTATFEFTVDDLDATSECRLDSDDEGTWGACDSPITLTDLESGEHTFRIRATDEAGNVSTPVTYTWQVDVTAPVVTIEDGPAAHTSQTTATIEFTSDDPDATFECRLDSSESGEWEGCESPFETAELADGDHLLEIRATDSLGNVSDAVSHAWNVDTVAPVVTIDSAPPAINASIHAVFEFSGNEAELTAECRLDPVDASEDSPATAWDACESPAGYSGLEDGNHRFEVRVTDQAGNISEAATHDWEVATVKPVASIITGPDALTDQTSAAFELESDNPAATFECRLDPVDATEDAPATGWEACESPVGYSDLADGEHIFEVRATETDQGTGPVATWIWTVDTTVPTVEITGAPAAISGTADPTFGFGASEPGTTAECRLDPADASAPWSVCVSPIVYSGLSEGQHRFEVRVTDGVGHISEPAVHTWIVETIPPGVTITSGPESPTTEIAAWFSFNSENLNAGFECRVDGDAWTVCASGVGYDQLEDGEHRFDVRAVGQGAGPGPVESRTWVVDTTVPTLTITSGPNQVTNETTARFELSINKPGFTFQCRIDAEPAAPCESPVEFTGLTPGDHTVLVDALDSQGEVVDSGLWQWAILADRPVASITGGPPAVSSSATGVFRFEADRLEAEFECRVDGSGPWSSCTSPAGFSGLGDGSHTFEVRANLPGSSAGAPVSRDWTIDTTAPDVSLTGGPAANTAADEATFGINTDDPGATTECRLDDGAWTVCDGEVTFNGLTDGAHVVRVRAVDGVGNTGLARRDWTVDRTPPVTTLTSGPEARTSAFNARFVFTANEAGATFECRLDGDAWKTCSSAHRVTGLNRGNHGFAVRATDRLGNVGEPVTHTWRIVAPAPKGLVPNVKVKRRVKLDRDGTARLAT